MIDFTRYHESVLSKEKTILSCSVLIDKELVLETLKHDRIYIDGKYYKVPENQLMDLLLNKRFGTIDLDLELIK